MYYFCFGLIFVFLCWVFPKKMIHMQVYLVFFSICALAPLIICFDLRFRNMFRKIIIYLLYHSVSVLKVLLQMSLLFSFLPVLRNLLTIKVLMISCCQTFIDNNVKGIQSSKKRLKLIQYFKDKIGSTGILFLQETHYDSCYVSLCNNCRNL